MNTWVGSGYIRLGWKGLSRTSTISYYEHSQIMTVKSFMTLGQGVYVINLFTTVIYKSSLLARVFVPGKFFQPSLMFSVSLLEYS